MDDRGDNQSAGSRRGRLATMVLLYGLADFNDNFFRQATMLLAIVAGVESRQGLLTSLFTIPYLLLAAPAGWLADRFIKRHIILGTKALEVLAMSLGACGVIWSSWPLLVAATVLMGLRAAAFSPALNGSIPEVCQAEQITTANAILKAVIISMILAGIALAGVALSAGKYLLIAIMLAVSVMGLFSAAFLKKHPAAAPKCPFPWSGPAKTLSFLWQLRKDRPLAIAVGCNALTWSMIALLQPLVNILARNQFGLSAQEAERICGILIGAGLVGVVIGSLAAGRLASGPRWQGLLQPSLVVIAVSLGFFAFLPHLSLTSRLPTSFVLMGLAGIAGGLIIVGCESFIQARPPAAQRGATIASADFAAFVGIFFSGPVSAALIHFLPDNLALAAVGAMCLAGCLVLRVVQDQHSRAADFFWLVLTRILLSLRYSVRVKGIHAVSQRGRRGILFLANHPALD